jgi:nucleoside 2-deoxyribosyltransferase
MKYYIASKLENHAEHNRLRDILNKMGHELTYDWTVTGPVHSQGLQRVEEVAQLEHEGVFNADRLIMLWPGGRGTHVELGMGIALGKDCIIISDVENHHIASPDTCAFYHHPQCMMYRSVGDWLETLN